jgi:hypothetical protein
MFHDGEIAQIVVDRRRGNMTLSETGLRLLDDARIGHEQEAEESRSPL